MFQNLYFWIQNQAYHQGLIEKKYFAITWGSWKEDHGHIDHPIKRGKKDPTVFEVDTYGRNATTGYSLIKRGKYLNQLFLCQIETYDKNLVSEET